MGHMSPRIKAKKGRFGAGGLAPTLNLIAFQTTASAGVGQGGFEAEASDDLDGDITATIDWASDLDAASVGTGGTPTITLTAVGTHTITVTATAPTGGQTTVETFQVVVS